MADASDLPGYDERFAAFSLAELDALTRALGDLKQKLEGDAYSLTVSSLFLGATHAAHDAYRQATPDERLAIERRLAGDSGLTSLEFRSGLAGIDWDDDDSAS